jgi:cobalt-zinc-cadmium efflux system outer membrane protein
VVLLRAQRSGCASRSALPGCARARPQQECDGLVLRTGVGAHRSRGRRTAVRLALACTLCMLISSCASFRPEPINLRVSARRFAARTVHSRRLTRYLVALGLPPENSWGFRRLTYVAVFERPQLTIANARYRAALGSLRLAEQIDNPKIGIRTAYNASQLLPTPWSVGPIFSFLIQNFFSKDALIGAARQNVLAARAAIDSVAWEERKAVYDALLALWADRRATRLYRRQAALDRSIARAVQERHRVGTASASALTTADLNAEQAAFRRHQAQLAAALATAHLAEVVGLPAAALADIRLSFAIFRKLRAPAALAADEQVALIERPAVRTALAQYNAAQYRLQAAIEGLVSGVKVTPGFDDSQQTSHYSLSVKTHPPLFNQHQGQIAVARAERHLAAAHLKSVQESVFGQIERAVVYWRESGMAMEASQRALWSAQRELAAAREEYRAGVIGDVRLLGVRLQVLSARIQRLSAEKEHYAASGDLMTALHRKLWRDRNATG